MKRIPAIFIILFVVPACLYAQADTGELNSLKEEIRLLKTQFEEMKSGYEDKIKQLESKVEEISQGQSETQIKVTQVASGPQSAAGRYLQYFNPDISVIGDFVYHGTDKKTDEIYNRFSMREVEFAFSAAVDPYAKADIFLSVEPEESAVDLEEGYLTFLNLPIKGLQGKLGKFKSNFGKVNRLHRHQLPWADEPNMLTNFFGSEGMSEPGISASYLIPNPWDKYMELTFEVFNNRNSESFAGSSGRDMVYLTHLKNFFDINEESTLELGMSFATGPNDDRHGKNRTNIEGIDLTYKWRPLKEGIYKSLTFQNEAFFSQKDNVIAEEGAGPKQIDSLGLYSSLQYQFAKRWSVFGRYDYSEFPNFASRSDNAYSAGLTFAQSEYVFWRLQFKHTDRNYEKDSSEVWLQCNFGLGPHRKHEY